MTPPDLFLATCAALPEGDPDTVALSDALNALGVRTRVVVWDDPAIDWSSAPLTVIRCTWDYHERHADFVRWLSIVPHLLNPAPVVSWNTDKRYLLDLESTVPIVPTRMLRDPGADEIEDVRAAFGGGEIVVKPAVGLDGLGVEILGPHERLDRARSGSWLVQPLVPSVRVSGETSVVVIAGRITHAARRVPGAHDFRVQERWGGRVEPAGPTPESIAATEAALAAVDGVFGDEPTDLLYARVDLVEFEGAWRLMELEVVEPSLFLSLSPAALRTMVDAIAARLAADVNSTRRTP